MELKKKSSLKMISKSLALKDPFFWIEMSFSKPNSSVYFISNR